MSCQNHPNKESVANCQFCGKELCEECTISIAGKNYCEECMSELVGPELASIASNSPNTATQNNAIPKQTVSAEKGNHTDQPQVPVQEEIKSTAAEDTTQLEEIQTPNEKTQADIREPEKITQEIPSQSQNTNNNINNNIDNNINNDDSDYDDIYSDDRLYNDIHGDESLSNPQTNNKIEEKYEKYLDDLYFDENPKEQMNTGITENTGSNDNKELSLSEQLAQDEAEHGSLTKEPFIPDSPEEQIETNEFGHTKTNNNNNINNNNNVNSMDNINNVNNINKVENNKNIPIMENLRSVNANTQNTDKEREYTHSSLHRGNIHYKKEEKQSLNSTEKILTLVLIILIILVAIYVIYLLTLHDMYPSFIDAIMAFFGNPGEVIGQIFS